MDNFNHCKRTLKNIVFCDYCTCRVQCSTVYRQQCLPHHSLLPKVFNAPQLTIYCACCARVYSVQCLLPHSLLFTMFTAPYCTSNSVYCTQCTIYSAYCKTVYSLQCILPAVSNIQWLQLKVYNWQCLEQQSVQLNVITAPQCTLFNVYGTKLYCLQYLLRHKCV